MDRERILWAALAAGATIGAGMAARQGAAAVWRRTRDEEPPQDVADRRNSWQGLLAWAAVSGFCVAFARVVGQGAVSGAWRKAIGRQPPV